MIRRLFAAAVLSGQMIVVAAVLAGDVPRSDNPAQPPHQETWTLQERWRVGGDDEDILLGRIGVVIAGLDGEVYALDSQLAQVQVFDADGNHLRTLGREGEGPGEFRQPTAVFLRGDGTVAVQQTFPGRISYLDPDDGTPRGSWELPSNGEGGGGFGFLEYSRQRGGTFVVAATTNAFDMETREIRAIGFLALIDADGNEVLRLSEKATARSMVSMTIDELANHNPGERGLWDIGPDGWIYLVPRYDAYVIEVYDADGELQRVIARDHEARVRTEAEKEEQRHSMRIDINGMEPKIEWKLQDRVRCIGRIQVMDDGTLWVHDSHGNDRWDEGRQTFAVFDTSGRLSHEVTIQVPDGGDGDRLVLMDDGRVALIKGMDSLTVSISAGDGDEDIPSDEPLGDTLLELVCYDVVR